MQQATGPNFSDAREKDVLSAVSEEMSQDRNWYLECEGSCEGSWEGQRSRFVTFAPAARSAVTVDEPMNPEPPVIKTCVSSILRERSIMLLC